MKKISGPSIPLLALLALCLSPAVGGNQHARAQDAVGFSFSPTVGWLGTKTPLRFIPDGAGEVETRIESATVAGLEGHVGFYDVGIEVRAALSRTFGAELNALRFESVSCGPDCTRSVGQLEPVGSASILSLTTDLMFAPPLRTFLRPYILIGAGWRSFSYSVPTMDPDWASYLSPGDSEGFTRWGFGAAIPVRPWGALWGEVVRQASGPWFAGREAPADRTEFWPQEDYLYALGFQLAVSRNR